MKILGISGSLREDSHNTKLLRAAAREVPSDVAFEIYDGLRDIPPYDEDVNGGPHHSAVARLREALAEADAVLFATPEYNHSLPGQLKNALDWVSRPLVDNPVRFTPVAVVGASTGAFGAVWAQAELRKVLAAMGARVVEGDAVLGYAHQRFDEQGELTDDEVREQLHAVIDQLVSEVHQNQVAA